MADPKARSNSYIPVYTAYGQLAGEMRMLGYTFGGIAILIGLWQLMAKTAESGLPGTSSASSAWPAS